MAGGSVSSSTTGSTIDAEHPGLPVAERLRRAHPGRRESSHGRDRGQRGAERHEPCGARGQVQRRASREQQEPEEPRPGPDREPGRHARRAEPEAFVLARAHARHPQITWIHRVATRVVAPTAITTVRRNPR